MDRQAVIPDAPLKPSLAEKFDSLERTLEGISPEEEARRRVLADERLKEREEPIEVKSCRKQRPRKRKLKPKDDWVRQAYG